MIVDVALYQNGLRVEFFVIIIFIFFLRWISPAKKDPVAAARRREVKRSLRALKRK